MIAAIEQSWLRRLYRFIALLLVYVVGQAASPVPTREEYGLAGTIGSFPIAFIVTVEDDAKIDAAHYSYASQQKRIPLRVYASGPGIVLTEPGGGTFRLHLTSTDQSSAKPLTFYTSTGLAGSWTDSTKQLPVKLMLMFAGTGSPIRDCALYPNPTPSLGAHFPNPGCLHTPNKAVLDGCMARPFTTNDAAFGCIEKAMAACELDQYDFNFCVGNVDAYLSQVLQQRLNTGVGGRRLTKATYPQWDAAQMKVCEQTTAFSPDGTGYPGDITLCTAASRLRLIQNKLEPSPGPIRAQERQ